MKISKERAQIFGLFFIVLMPELFTQIKPIFYCFALLAIVIFLISLKFIGDSPKGLFLWLLVNVYLLIIMFLEGNLADIDKWAKNMIFTSDLLFLLNYYVKKGKSKSLLNTISVLGMFMLFVNVISFVLFPNGIVQTRGGNYYFLGTRNHFLKFSLAYIATSGLTYIYDHKKLKRFVITLILSIVQFVYFRISTAITCTVIFVLMYVFRKQLKKILSMKIILVLSTVLCAAFVFLGASKYFSWFIVNFLHKDVGLNSRYLIWGEAVKIIFSSKRNLFFGNGIVNNGNFVYLYQLYWPAHNQWLEWLYEYGLFGMCLLFYFFNSLDNRIETGKDSFFILSICFVTFIAGISSGPLSTTPGFVALCLLPYLKDFRDCAD